MKSKQQGFSGPPRNTLSVGQALQSLEMPPTLFQGWERSRSESEAIQITRTACTDFYNIKRMYKSYNCAPYAKRFTGPQTAQLSLCVARKLNYFINNWKAIITDKWVLDCVQGFQIPFYSLPNQEHRPNPPISSAEQSSLNLAEVNILQLLFLIFIW